MSVSTPAVKGTLAVLLATVLAVLIYLAQWSDLKAAIGVTLCLCLVVFLYFLHRAPIELLSDRDDHIAELAKDRAEIISRLTPPEHVTNAIVALNEKVIFRPIGRVSAYWILDTLIRTAPSGMSARDFHEMTRSKSEDEDSKESISLLMYDMTERHKPLTDLALFMMKLGVFDIVRDERTHGFFPVEEDWTEQDREMVRNKVPCRGGQRHDLYIATPYGMTVWHWSQIKKPEPVVWPKPSAFRTRVRPTP